MSFLVSRDLTLVVCVWEAPPVELHSSPSCHLAVFDLFAEILSAYPGSCFGKGIYIAPNE